jgi:GNAT superfamily N-acetyltransferase
MDNHVQVRKAGVDDLDVIVDFIAEEASEAEGRSPSRKTLESGIGEALRNGSIASYWLLVDRFGLAIGCTSVTKEWSDWNAGYYWWIQSMYLAPSHRGKGYLGLLLDAIDRAARTQNCLELRLYVHTANKAAVRAYEKAGFGGSPYRIMTRSVRRL